MSGNDCWAREQGWTWRYIGPQYRIRSLPAEVLVVYFQRSEAAMAYFQSFRAYWSQLPWAG
jgi:hypothetical protein